MKRINFFVDGFNLYHSIKDIPRLTPCKWLDIARPCSLFISRNDVVGTVFYFTALARWNHEKVHRHQLYIRALQSTGVRPVYGAFRKVDRKCRADCKKPYKTHEEKRTDVNIALYLLPGP